MCHLRFISFDMEGTLITEEYSQRIWEEDVPRIYAEKEGISLGEARGEVFQQYGEIGDRRPEWYNVAYWFERLGLPGDWRELARRRGGYCRVYPEVPGVLERLGSLYPLVITSNTIREFLEVQLECFEVEFHRVFSAPSDFGEVKKSPQFYERIVDVLGVDPPELAHVGDHPVFDCEAARSLGIRAFHLDRYGERSAPFVVRSLEEFEARLPDA